MLKIFAQKSFIYFLGTMLNRGLALILVPIYTSYLQPKDYGILTICGTVTTILGIFLLLSLDSPVVLFRFKLNETEYRKFLATLWLTITIYPLIIVLLLQLISYFYELSIFASVPWHPFLNISLWIAYVSIGSSIALGIFRSKEQPLYFTLFSLASSITIAIGTLYFIAYKELGALGSLYGLLVGGIIFGLIGHGIIIREFLPFAGFDWRHIKEALKLYLPLMPHGIVLWLLHISDRWILDRYVPLSEIGIYSLAYTVGMVLLNVGGAQALTLSPMYFKNAEEESFQEKIPNLFLLYSLIPTYIALVISVLISDLITIFINPSYHKAALVIPWIILAYWFFVTLHQPNHIIIEYNKKNHWILYISLISAALNILLNLYLIPIYGIWAAAFNTIVAFGLMAVFSTILVYKLGKLPFQWFKLGKVILLCILIYVGSYFIPETLRFEISLGIKLSMLLIGGFLFFIISGLPINSIKKLIKPT